MDLRSRLQPELVDRYRLERELGRGGMAVVFLAHDVKHDRRVALKVLRPELFASLGAGRFIREIKLAAGLAHPHIVPLFDSGAAGGLLYYVMPYLTGESVREQLQREGSLPVAEAVRIAREVASALDYAHRHDIVHRDVKPENILIQDGHAMVADFGVARAINAAAAYDRLSAGLPLAVGTPDYMSPEQASAAADIDGRSDIYSLGCVLFEMLIGQPPFGGATNEARMQAHLGERAPSLSGVRPHVPIEVELAVATALAKRPSSRYQTAAAFAAALGDAAITPSGRWPVWLKRRWWAGLAAAAVLGGVAVGLVPRFLGAGLDRSRYVVVPFGHRAGAAPALLTGDNCELLLYGAFSRWRDVRLSDELLVRDAMQRAGGSPTTLHDARNIARRVGAGLLVWGEVAQAGDSVLVSAAVYDVTRGAEVLRRQTLRLDPRDKNLGPRFDALADSLLLGAAGGGGPRSPMSAGAVRTPWLGAWRAYAEGRLALGDWDLARAEQAFSGALAVDSSYPDAALWLAQVRAWNGAPSAQWGALPAIALAATVPLPRVDQARARALLALAASREPDACDEYRGLLAQDSMDFSAWYGLGECHRRDRVVVPDPTSPSGQRFRASLETAIGAYSHAMRINPSVHRAFVTRLPSLIFIEPNYYRIGRAAPPDTARFGAWPTLAADTLAFVPFPLAALLAGSAGAADAASRAHAAAVARNRNLLREIGRDWIRAFPASPDAHEALARILEADGLLAPGGGRDEENSALAQVRSGRSMAATPVQALRLAGAEVRLLLKLDQFSAAAALADSLLGAKRHPEPAQALLLAPLAALLGRAARAGELLGRADFGASIDASPAARAAAANLLAHAALGVPGETLSPLEREVQRLIERTVRPERRGPVRAALLGVPAVLAFPSAGLRPGLAAARGQHYLADLQWSLAEGDTAGVRRQLATLAAARRGFRPGDVALDATYQEIWLTLAVSDPAQARGRLDSVLTALPALGAALTSEVPQAAALVRAMALRAELAAAASDAERARWWSNVVVTLWRGSDPALEPLVRRMRVLSQTQ